MTEPYRGLQAFPHFQHFLDPMYEPSPRDIHFCRYCYPDYFATLAPGFSTCIRCGVVIHGVVEDSREPGEEDDVCEACWIEIEAEL